MTKDNSTGKPKDFYNRGQQMFDSLNLPDDDDDDTQGYVTENFLQDYQAGAAAEREACAKLCEGRLQEGLNFEGCAAAIRARANT